MRIISTRTHGILDYIVGVVLIIAPFIFDFATGGAAMWIPMLVGAATILYSLATNYECGAWPLLPMKAHLALDLLGGVLLSTSPWLFGFADFVVTPHVIFGVLEIGAALLTRTSPAVTILRVSAVHRA